MSVTKLVNMINPEVLGDMISAGIIKNLKFAPLAEVGTRLVGQPGNTLTMPKFEYIGDAVDVAEGEAIPVELLTTTSTQVTIKKAGKGVEISDESVLSGYGDPIGEAKKQFEKSIARKIDNDVLEALDTVDVAMTVDKSTETIGANVVADALVKFGEDIEGDKVLFIAPAQLATLRKDPDFVKVTEIKDFVMNGVVGSIWGCQIVISNKIVEDAGVYTNYIVKPGAIGIELKRDTEIETDRDIITKTTVMTVDKHYVAYLKDESKAIKIKTKA